MFSVNVLHPVRGEKGWVRVPVRKTPQGKFIWDPVNEGVYYLEWYEDGKRRRATAGTSPAEVLEARRRKILELRIFRPYPPIKNKYGWLRSRVFQEVWITNFACVAREEACAEPAFGV